MQKSRKWRHIYRNRTRSLQSKMKIKMLMPWKLYCPLWLAEILEAYNMTSMYHEKNSSNIFNIVPKAKSFQNYDRVRQSCPCMLLQLNEITLVFKQYCSHFSSWTIIIVRNYIRKTLLQAFLSTNHSVHRLVTDYITSISNNPIGYWLMCLYF